MKCHGCGEEIPPGEETDYFGRTLCEECYMRALSPARACDPWAVRSSQVLSGMSDEHENLTDIQARILEALRDAGGMEPAELAKRVQLKPHELERELATLRHMERVKGAMRTGRRIVRLWGP
jgi:predicted transcriptional regulator